MIRESGIYHDISAAAYHADCCPEPSLSSSLARVLLTQSPGHAKIQHPRLNPAWEPDGDEKFDFGAAAHRIILGKGADLAVIDCDDWRTKAAREEREAARSDGRIPIKLADFERAILMAGEFARQTEAYPPLLWEAMNRGRSEAVIAWQDRGIWCRAMVDKLFIDGDSAVLIDLKSTQASADPYKVSRRVFDIGYDIQAMFYRRGLDTVRPDIRKVRSLIISQETEPPFALSVAELSYEAQQLAEKKVLAALAIWERCITEGRWPLYQPVITTVDAPSFVESAWIDREINDPLLSGVDVAAFARPVPQKASNGGDLIYAG